LKYLFVDPDVSSYIKFALKDFLTLSYIVRFTVNPVCAKFHTYKSRAH
jgi:hypothetical protein